MSLKSKNQRNCDVMRQLVQLRRGGHFLDIFKVVVAFLTLGQ